MAQSPQQANYAAELAPVSPTPQQPDQNEHNQRVNQIHQVHESTSELPQPNSLPLDDSEAETEIIEDAKKSGETDEEDEEDRYWNKFQKSRRHRSLVESSVNDLPSSATVSRRNSFDAEMKILSDASDDDDVPRRMARKRKQQNDHDADNNKVSNAAKEPKVEKRRRGRPRKDSAGSSVSETHATATDKGRPKGRTPCQDPNKPDKAGRTKLFTFTGSGNLEKVKELISRGADVNFRDNAGWTPLHEASLKGQDAIASYLVQCGADVNARGFGDDTPLHDASSNGYPRCVRLLVDAGADVFALNSDKQTPLDVCDDEESSKILEEKMMQLNRLVAQDESGRTILHRACVNGHYEEAATLLKQGANANAKDNEGWTPLHEAVRHGDLEIAKLLIQHNADVNFSGLRGSTALHEASLHNHINIVKFLVENGADVEACNDDGNTAYNVTTSAEIRRTLAARLDELKKQRNASDAIDEVTFLSHAKQRKHRGMAATSNSSRTLSREERKIQAIMRTFEAMEQNKRGRRSRARAYSTTGDDEYDYDAENAFKSETGVRRKRRATRGRHKSSSVDGDSSREQSLEPENKPSTPRKVDVSKLDPHKKDTSGRTPIFKWAIRGDLNVVETLIKAGADPNARDNAGWTPLHEVALRGRIEVARLLLENGADPNSKGADYDTPLHDATENEHIEVVEILLKFGANPRLTNTKGVSSIDIAKESENQALLEMLEKAAANTSQDKRHGTFNDQADEKAETPSRQPKRRRLVLAADLEPKKDKQEEISEPALKMERKDESVGAFSSVEDKKTHARKLSGRYLPKKQLYALELVDMPPDGPHTPIPTPPPEQWHKVKEEKEYASVSSMSLSEDRKSSLYTERSLADAMRYLPLYTVQLFDEGSKTSSFYVVDLQVSMLLGMTRDELRQKYPLLHRRVVSMKEKERLWSPLSSMLCPRTDKKFQTLDVKEAEKRRFTQTAMYFLLLEDVVSLIKSDYSHLSQSLITITLDIGYKGENSSEQPSSLPAPAVPSTPAPLQRRPGYSLPPKFALKLQKCGKLKDNPPY